MENTMHNLEFWKEGKLQETISVGEKRSKCEWRKERLSQLPKYKNGLLLINRTKIKLIITDSGDPSVGMSPQYWEVEVPFIVNHTPCDDDEENLDFFRNKMIEAYQDFCEGRIRAEYDFELRSENDM